MTHEVGRAATPSAANPDLATTAAAGFYTRKATGLVRRIGVRDSFVMNIAFVNIALGALTVTIAPLVFPGVNLFWTAIVTTVLTIFPAIMYAILSGSMPRSGGDYVFVSRILHPVVGFAANFNITVWTTFFTAILCSWVSGFAASSSLLTIGTVLENESLVDWSGRVATKGWQFGIGLCVVVSFTVLVASGTRLTFRVLGLILGVMVIGQIVALAVLAAHDHSEFVRAYGGYANYNDTISGGAAVVFAVAVVIYAAATLINRRRGIDVGLAQQELPPE